MEIKKTNSIENKHINILCYGASGVGKTYLIKTLEKPLIISVEGGLLTLGSDAIDFVEIRTVDELTDVYNAIKNNDIKGYKTICLDSITEIAELILSSEKKLTRDTRQAYMTMSDIITTVIRQFRDLPIDTYFTAKMDEVADEESRVLRRPLIPGAKASIGLPYYFDEVFCLRKVKPTDKEEIRVLQTQGDDKYTAKDRSGKLEKFEAPNLKIIINKIKGAK